MKSLSYDINMEFNFATKIKLHNIYWFHDILLSRQADLDTFLSSPGYFYHTGRRGLWLVKQSGGDWCLFCLHPNLENCMLVFPSPGPLNVEFLTEVCQLISKTTDYQIRLCRILEKYKTTLANSPQFAPVQELVLDWLFPCVVFSAARIINQKGSAFSKFRQNIRKIHKHKAKTINPVTEDHFDICNQLFEKWAHSVAAQKNFAFPNLLNPNISGLRLSLDPRSDVQGCLVMYDECPVGFFSYECIPESEEVCCISMCSDRSVQGASEYTYFIFSEIVTKLGKKYFNLNGSETSTLDRFRKKLSPWRRYQIYSFEFVGPTAKILPVSLNDPIGDN